MLKDYNITYEEGALKIIANLSDGAVRDALSILERCINSDSKHLTEVFVRDIVGIVQIELIQELLSSILEYNVIKTKASIDKLLEKGKDLRYCLSQLINQTMNLVMYKSGDLSAELSDNLKGLVNEVPIARLNLLLKRLTKLDDDLRQTANPTIIFEACMLELATEIKLSQKEEILDLIKKLELKIDSSDRKTVIVKQEVPVVEKSLNQSGNVLSKVEEVTKAEVKSFKLLSKVVDRAAEEDLPTLYSALSGIKAYQKEDCINFVTDNGFSYDLLRKEEMRNKLTDIVNEISGKEFEVTITLDKVKENSTKAEFEKIFEGAGVPFTKID